MASDFERLHSAIRSSLVMVLAGGQGQRLYPLTRRRAKPAVRFAGGYRMIDFTLSNCVNSGLRRIYVLAQYAATSLLRHLRRGWMRLFADELGEFLDVLPPQRIASDGWYLGTADSIFQNLFILQEIRPDYVVLLSGDHAYKMDYRPMLAYHLEKGADLTIAALEVPIERGRELGVMHIDEDGRVVEFLEKPAQPPPLPGREDVCLVNMGVYIWTTEALAREVARDATQPTEHDFGRNIIPSMVLRQAPVYAYLFRDPRTGQPAYWRDIGTVDMYWQANMDLVSPQPPLELHDPTWPLYTAYHPLPPAKISGGDVRDSLISPGCIIDGAQVVRSVLSPGVRVLEGAEVVESIIFDNTVIGRGAKIRRAIIDEGLRIPDGMQIGINHEEDRRRFMVTESGITVVPQGAPLEPPG